MVLLALRNHPSMKGRAAWGETDVRRAGWVVSAAVSPHRESCISVGYTEIKYISCPFGQREWICRIEINSLFKDKQNLRITQSKNRLEISNQKRTLILIQKAIIKHSMLGQKYSQHQLTARHMVYTK